MTTLDVQPITFILPTGEALSLALTGPAFTLIGATAGTAVLVSAAWLQSDGLRLEILQNAYQGVFRWSPNRPWSDLWHYGETIFYGLEAFEVCGELEQLPKNVARGKRSRGKGRPEREYLVTAALVEMDRLGTGSIYPAAVAAMARYPIAARGFTADAFRRRIERRLSENK